MPTLCINNEIVPIEIGENVLDVARRNAVHIGFVCDGNGLCQMCVCRVLKGNEYLTPPNDTERVWLTEQQLKEGHRLSCQAFVCGTGTIEIITRAEELRNQVDAIFNPAQATSPSQNIGQLIGNIASIYRNHISKFPQNALYATRKTFFVKADTRTGLRMLNDSRHIISRMVVGNAATVKLFEQPRSERVFPLSLTQDVLPDFVEQGTAQVGVKPLAKAPSVIKPPLTLTTLVQKVLLVSLAPPARMLFIATALVVVTFFLSLATPFTTWVKPGRILALLPVNVQSVFPTLTSDVSNPNVMAGQVVILLPFSVAMVMSGWRSLGVLRWLFATLTASIALVMLVFTQSTGAFVALAAMLVVGIVLFLVKKRWHMFVVFILGIIGISILARSIQLFMESPLFVDSPHEIKKRIELWEHALYLIRDFPFTGIGMGTYKEVAHALYPFQVMPPSQAFHAHNILLQVGVDLGLPGLLAWVCLFLFVMRQGWRIYRDGRQKPSWWVQNLGIAIICSQVALLTHGMVDAVTWGMVRPTPLVWAVWGLALAYTTPTTYDGQR